MQHEPDASERVVELRDLPREVEPDASLQERTVAALRARALLRGPRAPWRLRRTGWLVAAGIVLVAFLAGVAAGRAGTSVARPEASFALMLYGSAGGDSTAQAAQAEEYGRWARAEHEWGRVIGGEALGDFVSSAGRAGTPVAVEPDELVGFFLIQAPDRAAATRLAAECPHVKYGGRVVVREIQPT